MAQVDGPVDVLEHRTTFGARRLWRRVAMAVVGVVIVSFAAAFVDRRLRSGEFDQILAGCQAAETDSAYAERKVTAMLDYATPLLQRPDATADQKSGMAALVRATASTAADSLAPGRSTLVTVTILPWHRLQLAARDACQNYLAEAEHRLRRVADDLSALDVPTGYLRVQQRAARAALMSAAVDPAASRAAGGMFVGTP